MLIAPEQLKQYLDFASGLAEAAGKITLKYFRTALDVESKADTSPVTIADRETEQFIRAEIAARFPDHGILGEEFGETNGTAPVRWIIDPIDGTKAFVAGVPLYTVLIALEAGGEAQLGVIHCPPSNETAAAARGQGCTFNGATCRVNQHAELATAKILCTDYADLMRIHPSLCNRLLNEARYCRTWADAYGYLLVASRRADVMIDPIMNLWDMAALKPIIEEAGGRFSGLDGQAGIHATSALAANATLHAKLLAMAR